MDAVTGAIEYGKVLRARFARVEEGERAGAEQRVKRVRAKKVQPTLQMVEVTPLQHRLLLGRGLQARRLWQLFASDASLISTFGISFSYRQVLTGALTVVMSVALSFGYYQASSTGASLHTAVAEAEAPVVLPEVSEETSAQIGLAFDRMLDAYAPEADVEASLDARTHLLYRYLYEWGSPLAEHADVIAAQPHWKLILAISFAESSLGKKCADNNCSGIGVAPGHALWRTYASKADWVVDLNKLLERRYKDKTLQQMCGVYVQPCNPGWMKATTQIMGELEAWQIQ